MLSGDGSGARQMIEPVEASGDPRAPAALCIYYNYIQDFERAALCANEALAKRDGTVTFALQMAFCRGLRESSYWPALAKKLNLPVPLE